MNAGLANKWNHIYNQSNPVYSPATQVLIENDFLLPTTGMALDLASGWGANAIFLAQRGLAVTALDISFVAIDKLTTYAKQQGLKINARQEKIVPESFTKSHFDVIVVSRFLDRTLSDAIIGSLKPNGLLFYQTFTQEKIYSKSPNNPNYLLASGALLALFSGLKLVFYRENASIGEPLFGLRDEVQFVGQKLI
jgi:2-polyprenyl-3-methyl-5-hydroxy-6-metoxy-1,4-benzoquinol methylase